jgi:hypothetical protein
MRPARFFASIALVAILIGLNAAAQADTPVVLSGAATAPVFPYGESQLFQVLGDTKGKKCTFTFSMSLNGAPVTGQGGMLPSTVAESVALPWTSPDLRLPASNGANYSILVQAAPNLATNACKGQFSLSFGVVPQIGKLTGISVSRKVAAVNQPVHLKVSGQTFGYCSYAGKLTRGNVNVANATLTTLPYEYDASFPDPGDYVSSADEIDVNGQPQGCTGHVKATFTVIPRPACPAANQYYQMSDDSEFGCLYPGTYLQPATYQCPTGYSSFNQFVGSNTQWGCKEPSKPISSLSAVNSLLGHVAAVGPGPSLGGGSGATPAPQTSQPMILKIQMAAAGPGSAWRPNNNVFYAGEVLYADISGNIPNSGGYDPNLCGYSVTIQDIASDKVATTAAFTAFKTWNIGVVSTPGNYRVLAEPYKTPGGGPQPCLGAAVIQKLTIVPQAAWVTGLKLTGFAYHFRMGDAMGLPQFCEACDSIFSPAHDREFLGIAPTISGTTPNTPSTSGTCAYIITQSGHDAPGGMEVLYKNGQPGVPADQKSLQSTNSNPPFWNKYNNDSNTITVTLTPGNDLVVPPCHVLGGKISKTITFTSNTNLPPVVK